MRPWLAGERSLERLNRLAERAGILTLSGRPVRFVPPDAAQAQYELRVFATGCVPTRAESLHDWFNALAWLAFPRTKARINALHAQRIPHEPRRRGRLRDLLTLLDEGGAIVQCDDSGLIELVRASQWKALFWQNRARVRRSMRIAVIGHAVLEKALDPWPGITCKAICVAAAGSADAAAADWLDRLPAQATPAALDALPVFGYPGWLAGSESAGFYDDTRYFRPAGSKMAAGVGQAAAAPRGLRAEESPGSAERDAG